MKWSMTTGCSFLQFYLLQRGAIHGLQMMICSNMLLHGFRGQSASPWSSPWTIGGYLFNMIFSMSCRGISAPSPRTLPLSPSSLTLASEELFLLLSLTLTAAAHNFLLFLKHIVTWVLPVLLVGSVLGSSGAVLELELVLSDAGSTPGLTEFGPTGSCSLPWLKISVT